MDVLKTVLDKATLPLALVVHRKLSELIERTTSIEIDPMKRRWRVEFGQRVHQEQQKAAAIQREITARSPVPVPPPPSPPVTGADQTGRDIVLEAWGAIKQAVYDGCMANGITMTSTSRVREALHQGSRNGTFLNEQRVTGTPLMVRHGDQIRLGESVFEVVGIASSGRPGGAKDQGLKGPGRSVVS